MRGHWLSRPDGTDLLRRVIANCKHKIHLRSAGLGEFAPILGPQTVRRKFRNLDLLKCGRMDSTPRMAARTVCREIWEPSLGHDVLGHDGTSGVAGAKKQYVVTVLHDCLASSPQPPLPPQQFSMRKVVSRFTFSRLAEYLIERPLL